MNFKWLTCAAVLTISTVGFADSEKPKFTNGDCVQRTEDVERWETPEPILKIIEVGRKKYRTVEWSAESKSFTKQWESHPFLIIDTFNTKVRCPK